MKNLAIAVFLATALVLFASASAHATVKVTVTGTISSGTDVTNVFGFGTNANLATKAITLVYTFNETQGTQSESCGSGGGLQNSQCQSSVSGSPGGVTIQVATGNVYPDTSAGSDERILVGYIPVVYQVALGSADTATTMQGNLTGSLDFDWRTAFPSSPVSAGSGTFNINDGTNQASGDFTPSNLVGTGVNCSGATSVALEINNDNDSAWETSGFASYPQPNILGGSINYTTTVNVLAAPTNLTLPIVTFAGTDQNPANEVFSIGAIPGATGKATMQYVSALSSNAVEDSLTGTMCNATSPATQATTVYLFYPPLEGSTTQFDIGLSQVDDPTFLSTAVTQPDIQVFLTQVPTKNGGIGDFLDRFFFVDTNNNNTFINGFYDKNGNGVYDTGDSIYCSNLSTSCITINTGITGTLASQKILDAANAATATSKITGQQLTGINSELLAVKLQVEHQLINAATMPSAATLNNAMGCIPVGNFYQQLTCSAQAYITNYAATPSEPYFFPVLKADKTGYPTHSVTKSIQYSYGSVKCTAAATSHTNCYLVGLWLSNAATYTQYKFTPFVQTVATPIAGGGVESFEQLWYQYSSHGWYQ
jgi:hypothetical protein